MWKRLALGTLLAALGSSGASALGIEYSKHNLSITGTGVHSTTTDRICVFCHTPHSAVPGAPLWSGPVVALDALAVCPTELVSQAALSSSLANVTESALCLGCHTAPLESLGPNMVDPNGTWGTSPLAAREGCLASHPIGFDYAWAQAEKPTKLRPIEEVKATLGSGSLYGSAGTGMECGSCHAVHDNAIPPFLRKSRANDELCLACHVPF